MNVTEPVGVPAAPLTPAVRIVLFPASTAVDEAVSTVTVEAGVAGSDADP
jgi:hypothetical protein